MSDDSQTQQPSPQQWILWKKRMKMARWNVSTLYQISKLSQVEKLDIRGMCEASWPGSGKRRLQLGHTILYSGRPDDQHTEWVALIISSKMKKTLMEWRLMGPRLQKVRFHWRYSMLRCQMRILMKRKMNFQDFAMNCLALKFPSVISWTEQTLRLIYNESGATQLYFWTI